MTTAIALPRSLGFDRKIKFSQSIRKNERAVKLLWPNLRIVELVHNTLILPMDEHTNFALDSLTVTTSLNLYNLHRKDNILVLLTIVKRQKSPLSGWERGYNLLLRWEVSCRFSYAVTASTGAAVGVVTLAGVFLSVPFFLTAS